MLYQVVMTHTLCLEADGSFNKFWWHILEIAHPYAAERLCTAPLINFLLIQLEHEVKSGIFQNKQSKTTQTTLSCEFA